MRLFELEPGEKQDINVSSQRDTKPLFDFLDSISDDCSEIFDVIRKSNKFLYRGVKHTTSNSFKGQSRNDRRPADTSSNVQQLYDAILSQHGFIALRSNSIFCSNSWGHAKEYGEPFIILPVNGFTYTWNKNYEDAVIEWDRRYTKIDVAKSFCKKINWDDWDVWEDPIRNLNHIKEYRPDAVEGINPLDFVNARVLMADFKPQQQTNILEFMNRGKHEIAINGTYYAFNVFNFRPYLISYFKINKEKML